MSGLKVLMVHAPAPGFHHDAEVLGDALRRAAGDVEILGLNIHWDMAPDYDRTVQVPPQIAAQAPFDIVFLFEHMFGHERLRSPQFARRRAFVPNLEWFQPEDEAELRAHPPDMVLYKNRFSKEQCERIAGVSDVAMRVVTGWTTRDFCAVPATRPKDFRAFLHIRGVSVQKQAEVLLHTWRSNPDFPLLTLITSPDPKYALPPEALVTAHNIEIIIRAFSETELRHYQHSCGVHVYPSYAEGFGHALNETRACGSVLVTTQGPPMSDLVSGDTGFLIPVDSADIAPMRASMKFPVRAAALADTVREVLATPVARLVEQGQAARAQYIRDQHAFQAAIRQVLCEAGIRCR
jgi:glycosyltransferase involved in cell wall biosynthesis